MRPSRLVPALLPLVLAAANACGGAASAPTGDAGSSDRIDAAGVGDAAPAADALAPDGAPCADPCPAPGGGVTWGCARRFMLGVNYAWRNFAADFGGIATWEQPGVAAAPEAFAADLADMRAHGAGVVRWWVFPDLRGDGVVFDVDGAPTALGPTVVTDLHEALRLADEAGVHLMLTLFSFDAFAPSEAIAGRWTPGLRPILRDPVLRAALLQNVVRPFARAAHESPHAHRLIAWDVINEPEWAIAGPSPYGDASYDPIAGLETVSHAEMEAFIGAVIAVLRAESGALLSVGAASFKWRHAWLQLDTDFHHFHLYPWTNAWWPYTLTPAELGLDDKPLVMGELPLGELAPGTPFATVAGSWWADGYAGALGWQYNEATAAELDGVAGFAALHPCETSYGVSAAARRPAAGPGSAPPAGRRASLRRCHRDAVGRPVCAPLP